MSLFLLSGCSTQAHQIGNSTAALIWYRAQYTQECLGQTPPTNCKERFLKLEKLRVDATAASEAAKYGQLPKPALAQIEAETKAVK